MSEGSEKLVWLADGAGEGAWNMALDEALYLDGEGREEVWVRSYCWREAWLSVGYFSKLGDVIDEGETRPVVRRMTGGGVVEHGEDFTFSVSVPAGHAWARLRGGALYGFLHGAVRRALEGVIPGGGFELADGRAAGGTWCFASPVESDVLAGGRKIVGGAMKRGRAGVIYQGSVQRAGLGEEFGARLVGEIAGGGFERRVEVGASTREVAEGLVESRYGTREWLERR